MTQSEALQRLQQVDLELLRRERALQALPQTERIKQVKAAAKKLVSELNKIVGARKDVQIELEDNASEYDHLVEVVGEVQEEASKGAADYRAARDFEDQLSHLAKKMEKLEFDRGPLQDRLAKLLESEEKARTVAQKLQAEGKAQAESYDRDSAQIRSEIDKLTRERRVLLDELGSEAIDAYEAARKRFGGIAVESLEGNKPSVCRVKLQPSDFADLKRSGKLVSECPYCHRILVIEPSTED